MSEVWLENVNYVNMNTGDIKNVKRLMISVKWAQELNENLRISEWTLKTVRGL